MSMPMTSLTSCIFRWRDVEPDIGRNLILEAKMSSKSKLHYYLRLNLIYKKNWNQTTLYTLRHKSLHQSIAKQILAWTNYAVFELACFNKGFLI